MRDLWPESIKTVDAMRDSWIIRYFEWQEMRCYRSARKIVVVTDSFKRTLVRRGIVENTIEVVKNGVDRALFVPRKKDEELLNRLGLNGKTIIGYIGTHGMAHKLDFILRCAKKMEGNAGLHFLFIGDGAMKESLLKFKDELGVGNVTMLESIPKAKCLVIFRYWMFVLSILRNLLCLRRSSPLRFLKMQVWVFLF